MIRRKRHEPCAVVLLVGICTERAGREGCPYRDRSKLVNLVYCLEKYSLSRLCHLTPLENYSNQEQIDSW